MIVTLNETSAVSPAFTSTSVHVIVPFDSTPLFVIESATNVVPSGTPSVTVTFPSAFPLFVNVIVYVNVSPTFAVDLSTDFAPVIFATFVSTSSVGLFPSITALFVTDVFVSLLIVTLNETSAVFPASNFTSVHVIVLFSSL